MPFASRVLLVLFLLLSTSPLLADTWAPPRVEKYLSADGRVRVTITPRPLGGALPYFQDKVAGKEPAGQRDGSKQTRPMALLERRSSGGHWQPVWEKPLVNDVAPVRALVTNDGRHVVTFDNWHSTGYGPDVVVIYDAQGELVRKMALTDFLPEAYVASLPSSVSSLWWGGEHRLDEKNSALVLRVREPGEDMGAGTKNTVDVRIRLTDGEVLPHDDRGWSKAMTKLAELEADRRARWEALRVLRASPLRVPQGTDARMWREYLVELRERLSESSGHRHGGLMLSADDGDYPDSAEGITYMLDEYVENPEFSTKHFVLVSPSSQALATLLAKHLGSVAAQSMKGAQISFVGTRDDLARVQPAALLAGADLVLIDMQSSYPGMPLADAIPAWFR